MTSVGCKSKKHKIAVMVGCAPNPTAPAKLVRVQHGRREVLVVPTRTI